MDLSNFPTMESAKQMLSMVSPIYDKSYVGKWIYEIMGLYYDPIINFIKGLKNEINPETATWALPVWAEEYGVEMDGDEESIRNEILSRRGSGYPMNPERLRRIAERLTGRLCGIEEEQGTGVFCFTYAEGSEDIPWKRVISGIDRAKQAHLSYYFRNNISETINISTAICTKERIIMTADTGGDDPVEDTVLTDENDTTLQDENENTFIP